MQLSGKRTLVIGGGGPGIGGAITRAFGDAGAKVVVCDVDAQHAREASAQVKDQGHAVVADVRSPADLARMIQGAVNWLDGLDVAVTVVGGQVAFVPTVPLHEMTDDDWDSVYEVNLRYVARVLRLVIPVFLDQGVGGSIISVGSVTGMMAAPRQGAYGVMKAGLVSLARTVAAEYSSSQIRMNVVAGGAIATSASGNISASSEWIDDVPLGRFGTPAEIASAALYLASDDASYITGQQIVIDGGVSSRGPFQ